MTDVFVFRSLERPNIVVTHDRETASRYGLNSGDVSAVVQAATGGQTVTQVLEGDRSFGLVVRWKPEYREDLEAMRNIPSTCRPAATYRWDRSVKGCKRG